MAFQPTRLTPDQALQRIRHYCAYQERCHQEVKERLYSFGLYKTDVEQLLSRLIEDDFLNEERFAIQFAGGKFRIKHWGRRRITYELKQRQVSAYCIKRAMKEIDEEEYEKVLLSLAAKKWASLKHEQHIVREVKTRDHLMQKGYEPELIAAAIAQVRKQA